MPSAAGVAGRVAVRHRPTWVRPAGGAETRPCLANRSHQALSGCTYAKMFITVANCGYHVLELMIMLIYVNYFISTYLVISFVLKNMQSQIFANPWLRIHDWQPHQWDLSRPTRCTTASSARLALRSKHFTISGKLHRLLNVIVCYKQMICHLCGLIWLKFARFDMYLQVKPTYTILFESWDSLLKYPSVQEYTPCYKW